MKKNIIIVATMTIISLGFTTQSCLALATSSVGLAVIKQVLLGGITKGLGSFKTKESFLNNDLINAALPQQLKTINSNLEKIGMSNLVAKEKDYIAQAAVSTVNISQPILENAVNNLTTQDAARIAQGGSGIATQILKEKTQAQLVAAFIPKVDERLNSFGIMKTMNTALAGNSLLSAALGNQNSTGTSVTNSLSKLASEQMVNGLFSLIQNYEQQNSSKILGALSNTK